MTSLIPFKHRHDILDLFGGLEDVFKGSRTGSLFDELHGLDVHRWAPRLDVTETDTSLEVIADLPGLDKKDIDITLDKDLLTIKGETKEEHETTEKQVHCIERRSGSFYRSVRLPVAVKSDEIKASFKNGVLTITLPKAEEGTEVAHVVVH